MLPSEEESKWGVRLPGLTRLWSMTRGRPEVHIAVLDGPVDKRLLSQPGLTPEGVIDHGTHVYSIISGSRDGTVPGIASNCTVSQIQIFDEPDADGKYICTQARLATSIREALSQRANIINISAAQQTDLLSLSADLSSALQEAVSCDALVVAAAGNHGCACDTVPASVPGVLAVGAHDNEGVPLVISNWGIHQRTQGIVAPGVDIPGACVGGGLCRASGTSFAAATVSGVAGLLMSLDLERGVMLSGSRIRKILIESSSEPAEGRMDFASRYLSGRLDVTRAVDHLLGSSTFVSKLGGFVTNTTNLESQSEVLAQRPNADAVASATADSATQPVLPLAQPVGLSPAGCACSGQDQKSQLVYAIGRLGVSFISQARRDSIWRFVNGKYEGDLKPISDRSLNELFKKSPFQAQSVVWTLSRTEVPMYAIVPTGAFAAETYQWLVNEWSDEKVEFVSIPGVIAGQASLYDGSSVDVLVPDLRGMYSWETTKFVKALADARKKSAPEMAADQISREMTRFLGKIYYSIRNRGVAPEERALNAAATNAFNFSPVIVEAGQDGLTLRDISVERCPLSRPGSDYFDVLLTFFNPKDRQGTAPLRARFTIDVSDTVPVMIGEPVIWYEY